MGKETTSSAGSVADAQVAAPLGVGIIPSESRAAVVQTALRARSNDCAVFVTAASIDSEIEGLLRELEITVLETSADERDGIQRAMTTAARAAGCEGLIFCEPASTIDFDASRQRVQDASTFSVDAVTEDAAVTTGRLVGIPAYNESVGIGSTVLAVQAFADEVVVIDDGSADNTVELVAESEATLLEHETNMGKGQALRTFFEYARESEHEAFVVLDGDGQHYPDDIPAVVEPIESGDADLVVGSRYLEGSADDETPFHRRVGQQVLDYLTFGTSGTKLTDTQSGFRAFSREAIETLSIRTNGMGVESEMIAAAQDSTLTITERPIDVRYEGVDGQTLNPVQHGVGVAAFLVGSIRKRQPLLFYGVPGVVLAGLGVVYGRTGNDEDSRRRSSLVLTLAGLLSVCFGVVLNRLPTGDGGAQ
jgi:hypothetical protein